MIIIGLGGVRGWIDGGCGVIEGVVLFCFSWGEGRKIGGRYVPHPCLTVLLGVHVSTDDLGALR